MAPKKLLHNLALSIFSTCLFLFAFEGGFRLANIAPQSHRPRIVELTENGKIERWEWGASPLKYDTADLNIPSGMLRPNLTFAHCYDSNPRNYFRSNLNCVPYHLNAWGLRGPLYQLSKPANVMRIIALGDSFTFGEGVLFEDTWVSRLERQLKSQYRERDFEIINFGVPGFGTEEELGLLQWKGLSLKPDAVILGIYMNDIEGERRADIERMFQAYAASPNNFCRVSWACQWLWHRWQAYKSRRTYLKNLPDDTVDSEAWRLWREKLQEIQRIAQANNIPLFAVIFPDLCDFKDYPFEKRHEKIREACARFQIPYLDLKERLRKPMVRDLWVHESDRHPNEHGHTIIAHEIAVFLSTRIRPIARRFQTF